MCDKITVIVNDLKKTHGTKLNIVTAKVGTGDSAKELKKAKIEGHGIIAKDQSGKLVVAVEGHSYGQKKVDEVVAMLLPKAE
jgi:hypothetical protein